jgi:hypothetical protein
VAFLTNQGLYEPTVMFFGLTNSPATFQTMMNSIFAQEMAESWLTIYMYDMVIQTQKGEEESEQTHWQQHQRLVRRVLQKLQQHNLFLKPAKRTFKQPSIEFLGVHVDQGTEQMDNTKIEKVKNWQTPFNVREVQKFLGFTGYYQYFIRDYSHIAQPLLDLMQKTTPWHWEEQQQTAFETLQDKMCDKPVL